ncbi:MAG: DUF2345 domain-containing protein, partial [Pseudomonadota bacterium]
SVNDVIAIKANQTITLQAGQSSITLDGGDITFACPGNFTVKGGKHVFDGAATANAKLDDLPHLLVTPKQEPYSLRWAVMSAVTGKPVSDVGITALDNQSRQIVVDDKTGSDGRNARQRDDKQSKQFTAFAGTGEWATEITNNDQPRALDSEDWMSWEAKE